MQECELQNLADEATLNGWQNALYDFSKKRVLNHQSIPEDARISDWSFLLPLPAQGTRDALVLGCGWGAIPIHLSQFCGQVCVVETSPAKIQFLEARKAQQRITNLKLKQWDFWEDSFSQESFDLVCLHGLESPSDKKIHFSEVLKKMAQWLRKEGVLFLNVPNRWSLLLKERSSHYPFSSHTLLGYRKMLERSGFEDIHFYAPLPHYNGIPLFYLPLHDSTAMIYFFKNIFPLFEMVSPESKKAYALEYRVAKLGVNLSLALHLTRFVKYFVSGFSVVAKKRISL